MGRARGSQLAVSQILCVCVTSIMENNTLFKRTRCICKLKNPTKPPMNTEPQTCYLLVFSVIIFLWVSWLKSQMQSVAVRAEPRRAGTFTTRYYSSSLLLTALDGKLFKSHLAQTPSLKWRCPSLHHPGWGCSSPGIGHLCPWSSNAFCHPPQPLSSASSLGSAWFSAHVWQLISWQ